MYLEYVIITTCKLTDGTHKDIFISCVVFITIIVYFYSVILRFVADSTPFSCYFIPNPGLPSGFELFAISGFGIRGFSSHPILSAEPHSSISLSKTTIILRVNADTWLAKKPL